MKKRTRLRLKKEKMLWRSKKVTVNIFYFVRFQLSRFYFWKLSFIFKPFMKLCLLIQADDFFTEDVPTDIAPVDANIGNPWGSTVPTEVATPELAKTPIKEAAGSWAAFGEAPAGDESSWAAFNDCEMKSVKPTEEDQTLETLEPKCEPGDSLPNATSEGLEMAT